MTPPTPYLADADVTLWHGDALDVLRGMDAESVDCVVTSPPYWGLRDYGTGTWEGGDPECEHLVRENHDAAQTSTLEGGKKTVHHAAEGFKDSCPRCGARRVDAQLGLEPTPDQYVTRMVDVFREVRRVLCPHGTCWVNLGDSYAGSGKGGNPDGSEWAGYVGNKARESSAQASKPIVPDGLKPKDLVGIPWRVAFALQADGWWLRSDIVWAKPNPMPESVTDRPTKAHEYVFLLTKAPRYYFDQEAVRERHQDVNHAVRPDGTPDRSKRDGSKPNTNPGQAWNGTQWKYDEVYYNPAGRNVRSVWTIATQPYPEAHFATYPEELVRRCVLAGSPERVCRECGEPSVRQVDVSYGKSPAHGAGSIQGSRGASPGDTHLTGGYANKESVHGQPRVAKIVDTVGWSDCGHNDWRPGVVLDPFVGSGTTCLVARNHGRHSVGVDLNEQYLALAATRLQQLSLLTTSGGAA